MNHLICSSGFCEKPAYVAAIPDARAHLEEAHRVAVAAGQVVQPRLDERGHHRQLGREARGLRVACHPGGDLLRRAASPGYGFGPPGDGERIDVVGHHGGHRADRRGRLHGCGLLLRDLLQHAGDGLGGRDRAREALMRQRRDRVAGRDRRGVGLRHRRQELHRPRRRRRGRRRRAGRRSRRRQVREPRAREGRRRAAAAVAAGPGVQFLPAVSATDPPPVAAVGPGRAALRISASTGPGRTRPAGHRRAAAGRATAARSGAGSRDCRGAARGPGRRRPRRRARHRRGAESRIRATAHRPRRSRPGWRAMRRPPACRPSCR